MLQVQIDVTPFLYLYYDITRNEGNFMSQKSTIQTFFNNNAADGSRKLQTAQRTLFMRIAENINTVLDGLAVCHVDVVATHIRKNQALPVMRFSLPNGASITLCDHGERDGRHAVISVRSPQAKIPESMVRLIDQGPGCPVPEEYKGVMPEDSRHATHLRNPKCFTVLSWDQQELGHFAAQFAHLQKPLLAAQAECQTPVAVALPAQHPDLAPHLVPLAA
jgi:hypothetical protein